MSLARSCLQRPVYDSTPTASVLNSGREVCHCGRRGQYKGSDILRLAVLKYAAVLGAPYVDVEYLAAGFFFGSEPVSCTSHGHVLLSLPVVEVLWLCAGTL